MNEKPYLSICIPTYNRLKILHETIESIYADLNSIAIDDFEIVISDNEPNQSSKTILKDFNYKNLHYYSTDCIGFLNSINALKQGNGLYLKLHNNYTKLYPGSLKKMIKEIKENSTDKPVIFYSCGFAKSGKIENFNSFDTFMNQLSYFSSWSSGFGIWKEDLDKYSNFNQINKYFPQTSLLLSQSKKSKYIINDKPLFNNQNVPKKGGYNIFKVFSIDYISLIEQSYINNKITKKTFDKIKFDLLFNYLSVRYFKTVLLKIDNFEKNDIKKNIKTYYSSFFYYLMIMAALFAPFKFVIRKINVASFKKNL